MDWTRLFRGLEARAGVLLLMGALVFVCAVAQADSRRIVITQDRDDNINVSVDPSLMPDANIRREAGRMVIELPDRAFPKGFEPGTLRVDSGSRQHVQVGRSNGATTVVIDSDQVFLSIQDLSPPPRKIGPAPAVPADVAEEMTEPPARPEPRKAIAPVETAHPRESAPKPQQAAVKPPQSAKPENKKPEPKAEKKPEKKPSDPAPGETARSKPAAESKPAPRPEESEPLTPNTLDEVLNDEALSSEAVGEVAVDETGGEIVVPEPLPLPVREGESGIPLETLMKQHPDPVTSDGTLLRIVAGLLAVLLMIAGFFKVVLPELMRRYPGFFKNRQEAYERKIAEMKAGADKTTTRQKTGERLLGLAGLRKQTTLPDEPVPEASVETEEEVYPLFRQAGIFPALGVQPPDEPEVAEVSDGRAEEEASSVSFRKPSFRLPSLPAIRLPKLSMPSLPRLSMPKPPKLPEIRLPEFSPPDFSPLRLKAAGVWSTMKKRMEPDPDRYMQQIKDMNGAFDVLYTRNLSRTKALHLVDLWGRHMIIITASKGVTLLGVMRGEGRDLYFEDLTVDNVKLLGEFARGRSPVSYILDFYHEARSGIVRNANRATEAAEEADFDDLYRKYLTEQAVRRKESRQESRQQDRRERFPAPEPPQEAQDTPKISVDVTDWNRPVFPKKVSRPAEPQPAPVPEPVVEPEPVVQQQPEPVPEPAYRPTREILQELPQEIYRPVDEPPVTEKAPPMEGPKAEEIRREEIRHREILQEVASVIRPRSVDDVVAEHREKRQEKPETSQAPAVRRDPDLPRRRKSPRHHPAQMEEVVYLQDYDDEY